MARASAERGSKMRLAVYTDYSYRRVNGRIYAERAFALFVARMADEIEDLVIVGKLDPRLGPARYPLPASVSFVELPYFESLAQTGSAIVAMTASLKSFASVVREVDTVWLLGPHPLAFAFAAIALARRRSVVLGSRSDFPRYVRVRHPNRRWMHVAGDLLEFLWGRLARLTAIVAVGPATAALYRGARTLEMNVSLVREQDIAPAEVAAARTYGRELRVLSVGRLEEEKNPLLLAEIAALLRARDRRWRLIVCGEGPLEEALRERCRELGVEEHVDLVGYVPHDSGLRDLYRSSHALLHVSWTEGIPQVLFEAFAARLPVVATAVGGVAEAASGAAVLIEPGDARAAADAVERVCGDAELRERLIAAGIDRVSSRTLDAEASRVAAFLRAGSRS